MTMCPPGVTLVVRAFQLVARGRRVQLHQSSVAATVPEVSAPPDQEDEERAGGERDAHTVEHGGPAKAPATLWLAINS